MLNEEVIKRVNEVAGEYGLKVQDDFYKFVEHLAEAGMTDEDAVRQAVRSLSKNIGSIVYELTHDSESAKELAGIVLMEIINHASEIVLQLHGDMPAQGTIEFVNMDDKNQCHD